MLARVCFDLVCVRTANRDPWYIESSIVRKAAPKVEPLGSWIATTFAPTDDSPAWVFIVAFKDAVVTPYESRKLGIIDKVVVSRVVLNMSSPFLKGS
ncbi:hypothetical protein IH824_08870 [candidate division KSB1 bacterium]|nr:hypothetical protein [candidate division KSB1 bacterium]